MGTNYYWNDGAPACPTCGHERAQEIHIGKSSGGWTFSFHGTDEIRSWRDWKKVLQSGGQITNEYGDIVSFEEFRATVEDRSWPGGMLNHHDYCKARNEYGPSYLALLWKDAEGYSFSAGEFS